MNRANADEAAFWNAEAGENWVAHQPDMDTLFAGVTEALIAAAAPQAGEAVVDIGCGAGGSTFVLAGRVGPAGSVTGLDVSAPLLAHAEARRRALGVGNVRFVQGDAQDHRFEGGLDLATSRFGVMFFADPQAAFRNIAGGLRPGGRLVFVAWGGPEHNPWFALPRRAAVARLGPEPPAPADAPGPMAFRDAGRVVGLMQAAGLSACAAETVDLDLHHPGGVDTVLGLLSRIGILPKMMQAKGASPADSAAIFDAIRAGLDAFRSDDGIRIPARVHLFSGSLADGSRAP